MPSLHDLVGDSNVAQGNIASFCKGNIKTSPIYCSVTQKSKKTLREILGGNGINLAGARASSTQGSSVQRTTAHCTASNYNALDS